MKPKTRWWGMLLAAERSVLGSLRLDPAEPTLTGVAILLVQDFGMTSMPLPTPPPANIYIPFAFTVEEDLAGKVTVWTLNTAIVLTNTNEGSSLQVNLLFLDRGGPSPSGRPGRFQNATLTPIRRALLLLALAGLGWLLGGMGAN